MKNVLVIDDEAIFCDAVKATLDDTRYTVTTAANGEDGLKAIAASKPDLILLDIKMPTMDGIDFLKQLNKTHGQGAIPVLITSNSESLDTITEGMSLGIRGYFIKSNESLEGIAAIVDKVFA